MGISAESEQHWRRHDHSPESQHQPSTAANAALRTWKPKGWDTVVVVLGSLSSPGTLIVSEVQRRNMTSTPLKLYHAEWGRSERPLWLLRELDVPFELVEIPWSEIKSPEYLATNPRGTLPYLVDGQITLSDSGAIVQYLLAKYGKGRLAVDEGTKEHAAYLEWFFMAEDPLQLAASSLYEYSIQPEDKKNSSVKEKSQTRLNTALQVGLQAGSLRP